MNIEFFDLLYGYNDWANEIILNTTAQINSDDYISFHKIGKAWNGEPWYYSVRSMLTHLMGAELIWLRRWRGSSLRFMPSEDEFPAFHDLRKAWEFVMKERHDYLAVLTDYDLQQEITYRTTSGQEYTEPLWELMLHTANHSTEHRGQLAVLLSELGIPAPPLDMIRFIRSSTV